MKVWSLHLDELRNALPFERWLDRLPEPVTDYVRSFRKDDDRWRVMAGKLLLLFALREIGSPCALTDLAIGEKDRPYFPEAGFDVNLSHSGERLLLALEENGRCGVDIERHRDVHIELFRRNFTDGEWEAITNADDPQAVFFKAWAVKEAVIKADGRGVEVLGKTEILSGTEAVCDGRRWSYRSLSIGPGYAAAVAADPWTEPAIIPVTGPELLCRTA